MLKKVLGDMVKFLGSVTAMALCVLLSIFLFLRATWIGSLGESLGISSTVGTGLSIFLACLVFSSSIWFVSAEGITFGSPTKNRAAEGRFNSGDTTGKRDQPGGEGDGDGDGGD